MPILRLRTMMKGLKHISGIRRQSRRIAGESKLRRSWAERDERASLMRHLTKTRDLMAELLNILDSIRRGKRVLMMKKTKDNP